MPPTQEHEFVHSVGELSCRCIATRHDRHWGHGVKLVRYDQSGSATNAIYFMAHPEHEHWDRFQGTSTDDMVRRTQELLQTGTYEESMLKVHQMKLKLYFSLAGRPQR